jgi:hypothetical protein
MLVRLMTISQSSHLNPLYPFSEPLMTTITLTLQIFAISVIFLVIVNLFTVLIKLGSEITLLIGLMIIALFVV